jgi:hypothetical protein
VILVIRLSTLSHRPSIDSIDKLLKNCFLLNLKVRNFLNFMTVATIIVVVKFSVYITIPSAKKLVIRQYIFTKQSPELKCTCLIALSWTTPFLRKYFRLTFRLYSKCSRLHKTTAKLKRRKYRARFGTYRAIIWTYRKPPTISPGLIYFRKRFLMGLYKEGLIYGGGGLHMDDILC